MHVTFLFAFSSIYGKTRTFNFFKVVRQHTEGMVGSNRRILSKIHLAFQRWKNFENPLRINKVIAMSLVYYFLGAQCICKELFILFVTCISSICIHSVLSVNVPDCLMSSWGTETAFSILPMFPTVWCHLEAQRQRFPYYQCSRLSDVIPTVWCHLEAQRQRFPYYQCSRLSDVILKHRDSVFHTTNSTASECDA